MIKAIYIAEDDSHLGLRTGDVIELETEENGDGYFYTDKKFGIRLYVENWEVEEIKCE